MKEIGIEGNGKKKDFHSFRHSFTDALKQQVTIPEAMIKQLVTRRRKYHNGPLRGTIRFFTPA
jgi:hypothetical protein